MRQRPFMSWSMIPAAVLALLLLGCRSGKNLSDEDARRMQGSFQGADASSERSAVQAEGSHSPPRLACTRLTPYGIVGGQVAQDQTQVTAATLKLTIGNQKFCSATLIGDQHVVTAAHCVAAVQNLSEIKIGQGLDGKILEKLNVEGLKVHPQYAGVLADKQGYLKQPMFDIAVLRFSGVLPAGLVPVAIANPNELQAGMTVIVSGYGSYGSDDKTRRPLSLVETRLGAIQADLLELQLTAGEGRGACYGDSGGPTFIVDSRSSCLLLIGSTTGPGRDTDYTCENGSGTLMDLTRYQSWLSCAFKTLNKPLDGLLTDLPSGSACDSK